MADKDKVIVAQQYVALNVEYRVDFGEYAVADYWVDARKTLHDFTGDCEDKAFLLHSLLMAGGISPDRLRTYFGQLNGIGHAWVAYKRDLDSKWIILDPTNEIIADVDAEPLAIERSAYSAAVAYLTDVAYVRIPPGEYEFTYDSAAAAISWVKLEVSASGTLGITGSITLPKLVCVGYGNYYASATWSKVYCFGTGSVDSYVAFIQILPRLQLVGTGKTGTVGIFSAITKQLSCAGTGYILGTVTHSADFPVITVYATGGLSGRFDPGTVEEEGIGVLRHSRY